MRNRLVDLLRAAAIIRVVTYHTLGFAWLTVVFPAMGLMFALGGSLMAASLDRGGVQAVGRRLRRVLPPVWVLGAFAVVAMMIMGGMQDLWKLVLWVLPLHDPPANEWGAQWLGMIWYIRSYLWFVILSPVLLWVFRRAPIPALLAPFVVLVGLVLTGHGSGGIVRDFFLYAPMWMLGFAHHDGMLERLSRRVMWPVAAVLGGVGLTLLYSSPGPRGYDLNDAPVADALWSTAFLLVLLSLAPKVLSLGRASAPVEAINRRALTIYLWHQGAITAVNAAALSIGYGLTGWLGATVEMTAVFGLVAVAVLALGWVEDLAARRRPAILPVPSVVPVTAAVERAPVPA